MDSNQTTSLYRYYDRAGVLLYAGITSRGAGRNMEHTSKPWWRYVTRQTVEHAPDRETALRLERNLISKYRPPFNKQHNPHHELMRRAYLDAWSADKVFPEMGVGPKWAQGTVTLHRGIHLVTVEDAAPQILYARQYEKTRVSGKGSRILHTDIFEGRLQLHIAGAEWAGVNTASVMFGYPLNQVLIKRVEPLR